MTDHHMREEANEAPPPFHPITVTAARVNNIVEYPAQAAQIGLAYPNGVILRIGSKFDDLRIASLIELY